MSVQYEDTVLLGRWLFQPLHGFEGAGGRSSLPDCPAKSLIGLQVTNMPKLFNWISVIFHRERLASSAALG